MPFKFLTKFQTLRRLLRVEQWYKNLLVFLPLSFSAQALSPSQAALATLGFCFTSSLTYMVNDWLDREQDRHHPTKKSRPFAAQSITGKQGLLIGAVLALATLSIAWHLGTFTASVYGIYFLATNAYSLGLKNIPILDTLLIASNFLLRTMAGNQNLPATQDWPYFALVASVMILFLTHKRRADIVLLGKAKAAAHKPVLKYYRRPLTYGIRMLAFIATAYSLFLLNQKGFPLIQAIYILMLIALTSLYFLKDTKLVLKPHHLLKEPVWLGTLFLGITTAILSLN